MWPSNEMTVPTVLLIFLEGFFFRSWMILIIIIIFSLCGRGIKMDGFSAFVIGAMEKKK